MGKELYCKHKALSLIPETKYKKPGVVTQIYNLSTAEVVTGGSLELASNQPAKPTGQVLGQ